MKTNSPEPRTALRERGALPPAWSGGPKDKTMRRMAEPSRWRSGSSARSAHRRCLARARSSRRHPEPRRGRGRPPPARECSTASTVWRRVACRSPAALGRRPPNGKVSRAGRNAMDTGATRANILSTGGSFPQIIVETIPGGVRAACAAASVVPSLPLIPTEASPARHEPVSCSSLLRQASARESLERYLRPSSSSIAMGALSDSIEPVSG